MKTYTYTNNMAYTFEPTHKGAPYCINGSKWANHGEWLESIAKFHRGYDYMVNPATSYDNGSDIEQMNASVKSSGASLASVYGPDMVTIMDTYFANVHSTLWIYMVDIENEIIEYHMDAEEFKLFLETFGTLAKESGSGLLKIRLKKTSNKMLKWLNERVEG